MALRVTNYALVLKRLSALVILAAGLDEHGLSGFGSAVALAADMAATAGPTANPYSANLRRGGPQVLAILSSDSSR